MANINVKQYEHINRSFKNWDTPNGKYIRSKAHYEQCLKEEGMVTESEAQKMRTTSKRQEYKPKDDTISLIESVRATSRNGQIRPSTRQIDALREKTKAARAASAKMEQI